MKVEYTHWIAFGLFSLFQFFSIGTFIKNIIKKEYASLNFAPAFFFFCIFLYFGLFNTKLTVFEAIGYLILLIFLDIALNALNYNMTKTDKTDAN